MQSDALMLGGGDWGYGFVWLCVFCALQLTVALTCCAWILGMLEQGRSTAVCGGARNLFVYQGTFYSLCRVVPLKAHHGPGFVLRV